MPMSPNPMLTYFCKVRLTCSRKITFSHVPKNFSRNSGYVPLTTFQFRLQFCLEMEGVLFIVQTLFCLTTEAKWRRPLADAATTVDLKIGLYLAVSLDLDPLDFFKVTFNILDLSLHIDRSSLLTEIE